TPATGSSPHSTGRREQFCALAQSLRRWANSVSKSEAGFTQASARSWVKSSAVSRSTSAHESPDQHRPAKFSSLQRSKISSQARESSSKTGENTPSKASPVNGGSTPCAEVPAKEQLSGVRQRAGASPDANRAARLGAPTRAARNRRWRTASRTRA